MKKSTLVLALAGGLALPLSAAAAGTLTAPLPPPWFDVTPIEQAYQQQQMTDKGMRLGAEGSAGATMFDRLDANMDGYINTHEADKSATTSRDFSVLDKDQDARISREEWKAGGQ